MNRIDATINLSDAAQRNWDVAIVGAGPAGAAAAQMLARAGAKTLLIDKARHPRAKVCGCCLNARSLDALGRLGIRERIDREGAVEQTEIHLAAKRLRATLPLKDSVSFSRNALDAALIEKAIEAGAEFLPETSARLVAGESGAHSIALTTSSETVSIRPRVILAADGLGGSFARKALGGERVRAASKIGAGVQLESVSLRDYPAGRLTMATGKSGYVGLVRIEDERLNVGAALNPSAIKNSGGIGPAVEAILSECRLPPIAQLAQAPWHGTPALTRVPNAIAAHGLFALGDAAGYVEPFTGEGIAWALAAAEAVVPLALQAVAVWSPELAAEWARVHHRIVRRRQALCRGIAATARVPQLTRAAIALLAAAPALAGPVLHFLNAIDSAPPEARPA